MTKRASGAKAANFSFASRSVPFPPLPDPSFVDYDVNEAGELIYSRLASKGVDVYFPSGVTVNVPITLSGIRWFGKHRALLFEYRVTDDVKRSAWSVDEDGTCRAVIDFLGDGIRDVLITESHVLAAYYDQGIFGDYPLMSDNGLSVFDSAGKLILGWNAHTADGVPFIYDCYCIANLGEDRVGVHIYASYKSDSYAFGILDIRNRSVALYQVPHERNLTTAMTCLPNGWWCSVVTDPTGDRHKRRQRFFAWRPERNDVAAISRLTPRKRFRGLPNGRFLEETQLAADIVTVSSTRVSRKLRRPDRAETFHFKPEEAI